MCVIIPETQKKQPAEGLPPNWTFVFSRDKRYGRKGQRAYVPGLFIFHPDCDVAFRSVEAAVVYVPKLKAQNPKVVSEFNRHIGIVKSKGDGKEAGIKSIMRSSRRNAEADLGQAACGECENCAKQACRKCAACKSSTSGMSEHCFQKVIHMTAIRYFWKRSGFVLTSRAVLPDVLKVASSFKGNASGWVASRVAFLL